MFFSNLFFSPKNFAKALWVIKEEVSSHNYQSKCLMICLYACTPSDCPIPPFCQSSRHRILVWVFEEGCPWHTPPENVAVLAFFFRAFSICSEFILFYALECMTTFPPGWISSSASYSAYTIISIGYSLASLM